ncbi:hypothetical protein FGG08_004635 [Glutinoglossum americanum]|uniref:DNA repair protein Rad26 n=1 Tax=Glutinoglossum americanum TaxID=1670608 RepID=A0A9P8HW33_9PEZI|nr:hypothetical protein FGG08_004635 [Glutinoglossum americanum]
MAKPDDDDDGFSDDDLDALPADTLEELEQTAARLTQRNPSRFDSQALQQQLQQTYQTLPTLPSTRAQTGGFLGPNSRYQQAIKHPELPSSDYGNFDEEAIQAELLDALDPSATIQESKETLESKIFGDLTQREQSYKNRHTSVSGAERLIFNEDQYRERGDDDGDVEMHDGGESMREIEMEELLTHQTAAIESLNRQIQDLRHERDTLQESLETANSDTLSKAGEIAIVRANQAKVIKEHERKMTAMQNLHADEVAKKKVEIEAALAEKERVATENKFLKKDLADESEAIKNLRKTVRNMDPRGVDGMLGHSMGSPITTPKKLKNLLYRDGFDDDEIMMSPTKTQGGRGRPGTPKTGTKRKRRGTEDSPGLPIRLSQPNQLSIKKEDKPQQDTKLDVNLLETFGKEDERFQYGPLYLMLDLVRFILTLHTTSAAPHLMDSLVPLAQTTADINAMVQFKRENMSKLKPEVSVTDCLSLLHMTALGCVRDDADIRRFWRLMRFDFVLMMLNPNQPIEDIHLMLDILSTGVLSNSFGPFVGTLGEEQTTNERHVISRVTGLLLDSPNSEEGKEPYNSTEIAGLNQDVLELLGAMCCTEYGGKILALHPNVVARLVKVMNEELESLYDFQDGHGLRAQLVNTATRLLHHLLTAFSSHINLQAKLNAVHGGMQHKYLLSVTRLAFSEGQVLEAGIEDDVVECAYELLENMITTPEEGDALTGVFVNQGKKSAEGTSAEGAST